MAVALRTIDKDGNFVSPTSTYYDDHPLYSGIATNVVNHGQDMAFIPPYYTKFWKDPEDENHTRIFISPYEEDGFALHPAFRCPGGTDGFLYGRCLNTVGYGATATPNSLKASSDNTVYGISFANANTMCNNMNTGGEQGWHIVTVWEDRAIELLLRMEGLTYYPQARWGGIDSLSGSGIPPTDPRYGKWRDIYAIWQSLSYSPQNDNKLLAGIGFTSTRNIRLSLPEAPTAILDMGLPNITGTDGGWADAAQAGFNALLNVDVDMLLLPVNLGSVAGFKNIYSYNFGSSIDGLVYYSGNTIGLCMSAGTGGKLRIAKWL
jgi:hypothetical protein